MMRALCSVLVFAACFTACAHAAPIFVEDFEDGQADGWAASGGDARLSQYAGNTSLRLSGRTAVVARVSTAGFTDVTIAAAMAGSGLEAGEYCLVEASPDGGVTWLEVLRVDDSQDDGVTLHAGALHHASFSDASLLIGARNAGNGENDRCWLDNVRVAGAAPAPPGPRTALGRAFLLGSEPMSGLTAMAAFAPSTQAQAPRHQFSGELSFSAQMTGFHALRDTLHYVNDSSLRIRTLPPLAIGLVQDGDRLIPTQRGPIASGHPSWEFALEPGRVWSEPGDGAMSRAALPFALIETNANCTHNGVLSFLFGDQGVVSRVAWQIASETCAYFQFDAWGVANAAYLPGAQNAEAIVAAEAQAGAARMPTRPFASLADDYPGIDLSAFASPADVNPAALTTFGVIANGVHYLGGCDTRAGPYPFCEDLLAPSYSLAKSLVAGLGLMRLELLHPGAMAQSIRAHAPACAAWRDATFEDALDMATGRYSASADQADENALTSSRFFLAATHAEKINIACGLYPHREAPGQRFVYHTTDTYVLGAAMAHYWRETHGSARDFFDDVLVDGVYAPLGLSAAIGATRRTGDSVRQPFTGWGLTLTRDDIAKLGAFLTSHQSQALVAQAPLDAALQRDDHDRGLEAGASALRYNNGFWAYNAQAALNCADPVWIPFLSGFGGVIVTVMPNGVVYYYVSDGGDWAWARAARAAQTIAPLCARTNP